MKAEERAILCCLWSADEADGSHEPCDFCKPIAQHIREAEQQARREALEECRKISAEYVGGLGVVETIDGQIQALIEREGGE